LASPAFTATSTSAEPIYLRVPPGHAKQWKRYCQRYRACGRPVYFVQEDWYRHEYAPRYRERHLHRHDRRDERFERRDDRRDDRRDRREDRHERRHDDHDHGHGRGRD